MTTNRQRCADRIPVELRVQLLGAQGPVDCVTASVSNEGLFIKTDTPKPLRQLVRLRILLGDCYRPMELHGMVVQVVEPHEAKRTGFPPGMEVEFVAFRGEQSELWARFLRSLSGSGVGDSPAPWGPVETFTGCRPLSPDASPPPSLNGVAAPMVRVVFPIPLQSVEQLETIYQQQLPAGTMFLCTAKQLPRGSRVTLRIVHPRHGNSFDLHGKVQKVVVPPDTPGLVIELRPSTIARRDLFRAFIDTSPTSGGRSG